MSGEGVPPFDRRGGCLCGSLPVNRQHPCPLCAGVRDYRPGDHVAWKRDQAGDFLHEPHEDFSVDD